MTGSSYISIIVHLQELWCFLAAYKLIYCACALGFIMMSLPLRPFLNFVPQIICFNVLCLISSRPMFIFSPNVFHCFKEYASCKAVYDAGHRVDGIFKLTNMGHHFCKLTTLSGCRSGGWTLIMKTDGNTVCIIHIFTVNKFYNSV